MPRFLATIALLMCLVPCSNLSAQEPAEDDETAEAHYQTAVRLFGEGRYREALDEFDAAIALSPESIFYCNRAIVLIKLREPGAALESLETCQQTHTGGAAELAEIDAQRQAVGTMLHHIRPGVLRTVSAINAPAMTPDERRGWGRVETGIVFLGVGGAALASAATLDFLSTELKDDLASAARQPGGGGRHAELLQEYKKRRLIWVGLTGAGAAFTLTGAVLVFSKLIAGKKSEDVEVGATLGNPGMFVRWKW